jgi:hypothetical protein
MGLKENGKIWTKNKYVLKKKSKDIPVTELGGQ